uniref:Arf-GAP domain-containing protein n=1 Tax=Fagus sylvatica TaxID=28930 RepID=A0A2N9GUH1_FAGSY
MGNEKSNSYWEAELPPNFDRSGIEKYIRAKYEEKIWVAKNATQPTPRPGEMSFSLDNFLEGGAETGHPKKTRKLSLEEAILTKHLEQDSPPVTRSRGIIKQVTSFIWLV